MKPVRVGIADDSVVVRRIMTDVLTHAEGIELVFVEKNGEAALRAIEEHQPDVVVLDIEMPVMDGIEALRRIRARDGRLPVIMFSTMARRGAAATMEAMALGASDYVTKPSNLGGVRETIVALEQQLLPRLIALCERRTGTPVSLAPDAEVRNARRASAGVRVVVVGASTGGPVAVTTMLRELPAHFAAPVLVVQHMPPVFTTYFAEQLNSKLPLPVKEADDGDPLSGPGVWIAPGGFHMQVRPQAQGLCLALNQDAPVHFCRPAVDVLFKSAAEACGKETLAVVLTGMGQDGLAGARAVHEAGGVVAVQDEQSSVVWGMPGCVSRASIAGFAGAPDALGRHMVGMLSGAVNKAVG